MQGKHAARGAAAGPAAPAALSSSEPLARLAGPDASATELASEPPGPQLGELDAQDRTALELGAGNGQADEEEDDPWNIPASHEVLLQGRPLLASGAQATHAL